MRRSSAALLPALSLLAACAPSASQRDMEPSPAAEPVVRVDTVTVTVPATPTMGGIDFDTVRAGRFDNGKMWTFEYPPLEYFRETYDFAPDTAWFARARLGALRLPNCSASFVSPHGLVLTNHHCARESVTAVQEDGERLLDEGFYATDVGLERPVEDFHADQLIAIVDVSAEMDTAADDQAREAATTRIRERLVAEHGGEEAGIIVEVIALWNGARTSAYVFRRYTDIRLVLAPELQMGYYGGDADNFTYPRYALDMSFFRIYHDGAPLETGHYFPWSTEGVEEGDAVFVIGNPGSTSRLQTASQLEFRARFGDRAILDLFTSRANALQQFADAHPDEAEALDLRNRIFSLLNSKKAYGGIWEGLQDPVIMAKRRDADRRFQQALAADSGLAARYGSLHEQMADIQRQKAELGPQFGAFLALGSPSFTSAVLLRGLYAFQYLSARSQSAPQATLDQLLDQVRSVGEQPHDLQAALLGARLTDMERHLGSDHAGVRQILKGRAPADAAAAIVRASMLADSARAVEALKTSTFSMEDPAYEFIVAMLPAFGPYQSRFGALNQQESEVERALGRARFDVDGTAIPPDATFSLRIADGIVLPYEYNGTTAPVYTTFYGLYDHYHSYGAGTEWDLPARWLNPPEGFDLSTPVNFVMTSDIIGGNSGSPVLDQNLDVVGLIFDGNIQSLPGDYIYLPEVNRAVAVDARGMLEALDEIYDADRIVLELTTGELAPTEQEADAVRRNP